MPAASSSSSASSSAATANASSAPEAASETTQPAASSSTFTGILNYFTMRSSSISPNTTTATSSPVVGQAAIAADQPSSSQQQPNQSSPTTNTAPLQNAPQSQTHNSSASKNTNQQDQTQARLIAEKKHSIMPLGSSMYVAFSNEESAALEQAFTFLYPNASTSFKTSRSGSPFRPDIPAVSTETILEKSKVVVGEDGLFECDILERIYYPIYWEGPQIPIVRGTWFKVDSYGKIQPFDEVLASQLEDGYQKFQPWKYFPDSSTNRTMRSVSTDTLDTNTSSPGKTSSTVDPAASSPETTKQFKWNLFGPYSSYYVLYTGHDNGWLLSESATSKVAQMILSRFSAGENLGGDRIFRGSDNADKFARKRMKELQSSSSSLDSLPVTPTMSVKENAGQQPAANSSVVDPPPVVFDEKIQPAETATAFVTPNNSPAKSSAGSPAKDNKPSKSQPKQRPVRMFKHLVFAVHGMGQKLADKTKVVNFIEDGNTLRKNVKKSFCHATGITSNDSNTEETVPIMVLPIEWRRKLSFDYGSNEELQNDSDIRLPSVLDITLEGVPNLRSIISDVLLDVLLYMEPHHRHDILSAVISEMNRVYRLFIKYHPYFLQEDGQIHFYAHSLGSLICLDILSYFSLSRAPKDSMFSDEQMSPVDLADMSASTRVSFEDLPTAASLSSITGSKPSQTKTRSHRSSSHPISTESLKRTTDIFENRLIQRQVPFLGFDVAKMFVVGSPLGLFMLIKERHLGMPFKVMKRYFQAFLADPDSKTDADTRFRRWLHQLEEKDNVIHPDVNCIFHMFHPNDVIAYRLEPMISRAFAELKPLAIPNAFANQKRTTMQLPVSLKFATESLIGFAVWSHTTPVAASKQSDSADHTSSTISPSVYMNEPGSPTMNILKGYSQTLGEKERPRFSAEEVMHALNPRNNRLDYVLQASMLDLGSYSAFALGAHFIYWANEDCGMFLVKEVLDMPSYQPEESP